MFKLFSCKSFMLFSFSLPFPRVSATLYYASVHSRKRISQNSNLLVWQIRKEPSLRIWAPWSNTQNAQPPTAANVTQWSLRQKPMRKARVCMESQQPVGEDRAHLHHRISPGAEKELVPSLIHLPSLHGNHHTSASTLVAWETNSFFPPHNLPQTFGIFHINHRVRSWSKTTKQWVKSSGGFIFLNNCWVYIG